MFLLSFGSGVAALIYEVVWFQLLELVIGASTFSVAVILATFMIDEPLLKRARAILQLVGD